MQVGRISDSTGPLTGVQRVFRGGSARLRRPERNGRRSRVFDYSVRQAYCSYAIIFRVRLPFLDRVRELTRLRRALSRPGGSLIVVYGRRRCGKSRLLQEALRGRGHAYYLADLGDAGVQRRAPVIGPDTVMATSPEPPKDAAPKDAGPSSGRIR